MKKAVSILCLLAVFTAAAAGCNNNNNNSTTSAPGATNAAQPAETTVDEMAMTGNLFKKGVWAAKKDGEIVSYFIFTDESNGRKEDAEGMGGVPFTCEQNGIEVMFHFGDPDDNTKATFSLGDTTGVFDYGEGNTVTYEFMYLPEADADTFTVEAPEVQEGAETISENTAAEEIGDRVYTVSVINVLGNPVPDINVQFCSEEECMLTKTDANGLAVFEVPEGKYTAHLLKIPEGYNRDDTEYEVPEKYGMIQIVLKSDADIKEKSSEEIDFNETDCSDSGVIYSAKGAYKDLKGIYIPTGSGTISTEAPFVWFTELTYFAVDKADAMDFFDYINNSYVPAVINGDPVPAAPKAGWENWSTLMADGYSVYAVDSDSDKSVIEEYFKEKMGMELEAEEIGKVEDVTFYITLDPAASTDKMEAYKESMAPEFFEEYKKLIENKQDFIDSLTLVLPKYPITAEVGSTICFETCDLDGNEVKSADLFKDNKVTMINVWGTTCAPCLKELPELEALSGEIKEKGVQLIGICANADSLETMDAAKQLLKENSCTYPCYASFEGIEEILPSTGIPATFFVDSEGKLLTEPVIGAYIDQYKAAVEASLEAVGAGTATE